MKRHREVKISSSELDAAGIARYIESFAIEAAGWEFLQEKSLDYEKMCGEPSCCIVIATNELPRAAIHLSMNRPNALRLTNIVPLVLYKLSLDQYNAIALTFTDALRKHARTDKTKLRISLSKELIFLDDIISGDISKKRFRQYLGAYPVSHHPSDIDRLDVFICAVSRFAKRPFDHDGFEHLLMEELNWSASDARWCRTRVEIGLEVLAVYRR